MVPCKPGIRVYLIFPCLFRWDDDVVFKNCAKDDDKDKVVYTFSMSFCNVWCYIL